MVEIEYQSIGKPASIRKIEPYGLAVYQSSIYVVAALPEVTESEQRLRNWKLDRFQHATLLDEYFKPDPDIDLSKYLGSSIGIFSGDSPTLVKIRIGKRSAAYLTEDPWHPDQSLDEQDGAFVLTVPAAHPRELLPKVLSLGADAEVLEPAEFRETVATAVAEMANSYAVSTG